MIQSGQDSTEEFQAAAPWFLRVLDQVRTASFVPLCFRSPSSKGRVRQPYRKGGPGRDSSQGDAELG